MTKEDKSAIDFVLLAFTLAIGCFIFISAQIKQLRVEVEALAQEVKTLTVVTGSVAKEIHIAKEEKQEFVASSEIALSPELQQHAYELCKQNDIPYELLIKLMWRESRFQINAIGYNTNGTQDSGLMQINDVNRDWLYEAYELDISQPKDNITAAVVLIRYYLNKGYTLEESLAAYGAGETGMLNGRGFTAARKLLEKDVKTNPIL